MCKRLYLRLLTMLAIGAVLSTLGGCAGLVTQQLGNTLSSAIVNQDDPETVRAGAPAYLLLIDGFIADNPDDERTLLAGARLYSAYATIFADDKERAIHMAQKARDYARRAICRHYPHVCEKEGAPYDKFVPVLYEVQSDGLEALYVYATTWAARIQVDSSDWIAVADLPKVEAVLRRVVAMDDNYANGQAHLYLAVLNTLLPPALGGRPEVGKAQFEKAIAISQGKDLMVKVEMARRYARMVYDRELHDRLLQDVLQADPHVPGLTLGNVLAQQQAKQLLETSSAYFAE